MVAIANVLIQQQPQRLVLVQGDANVSYEKVITGIGLLQQAGAPKVGLSTQAPEEAPAL